MGWLLLRLMPSRRVIVTSLVLPMVLCTIGASGSITSGDASEEGRFGRLPSPREVRHLQSSSLTPGAQNEAAIHPLRTDTAARRLQTEQRRAARHHGWTPQDDGGAGGDVLDENVTVVVGLKINFDHGTFRDMFDPDHPTFREFHSYEESRELATEGLDACGDKLVTDAEAVGLTVQNLTRHGEYHELSGTARQLMELFRNESLEVSRFGHEAAPDRTIVRAVVREEGDLLDLLRDDELRSCIGAVMHLADFPHVSRAPHRNSAVQRSVPPQNRRLQQCGTEPAAGYDVVDPGVLFQMYDLPPPSTGGGSNANTSSSSVTQAIYEGFAEQVSQSDLTCFTEAFSLPPATLTGDYSAYNTDSCGNSCDEPNLDSQYLSATNEIPTVQYLTSDTPSDMVLDMLSMSEDELPHVVSISYGQPEMTASASYMQHVCQEIGTLSGRGVSFFASAGDWGATNSGTPGTCEERYSIQFPASCPFVTAVGATTGFSGGTEVVANAGISVITSGGGFSEIFDEGSGFDLSFQEEQVKSYLNAASAQGQGGDGDVSSVPGYPTSGSRGIPDISAAGTNYKVKIDGNDEYMCGTSASTPVVAGMVARVMSDNGGVRFGSINHVLYDFSGIFFDVGGTGDREGGQNSGTGTTGICPSSSDGTPVMGFAATPGWDPASGLGTLGTYPEGAYPSFAAALMNEPLPPSPPPVPAPQDSARSTNGGRILKLTMVTPLVLSLSLQVLELV